MAETLISPGVLARENDTSQITQGPVTVGAAIIGPSIKGPVEVPTLITSYSEYLAIFGGSVTSGSQQYSYLNQVAANNYFRQGGSTLLVTRVTSGSFSSAKTTDIDNNIDSGQLVENANLFTLIDTNTSDGNDGTTQGVALDNGSGTGATADVTIGGGAVTAVTVADTGSGYKVGDLLTLSQAIIGGTTDVTFTALTSPFIQHDAAFELSTISQGAIMNNSGSMLSGGGLVSGSKDNVRWEITAANTSTGVFSLAIRRGDDENAQKSVLETFNNVSLDPLSTNYIETVVGNSYYGDIQNDSGDYYIQENGSYVNRSKYVYVTNINETPSYLDGDGNPRSQAFKDAMPVNKKNGSFKNGTGTFEKDMEPTIFRKTILRNFFFIKNDVSSCHFRTSIGYKLIRKKKNNTARFRSWDLRLMRTIRYHCATVLLHGLAKKNACTMIFSSWIIINPKYMNCWATKA